MGVSTERGRQRDYHSRERHFDPSRSWRICASDGYSRGRPKRCNGFSLRRGLLVLEFPRPKPVLMLCHVDALAAKTHAFQFQPDPLLVTNFVLKLDLSTNAHDALPGQSAVGFPEHLRHLTVK